MLTLAFFLLASFSLLLVVLVVRFQSACSADLYNVECDDKPEYDDAPDLMASMDSAVMHTIGQLAAIRPIKGEQKAVFIPVRTPILTKATRRIGVDAPDFQVQCGESSECETGCFEAIVTPPAHTASFYAMKDTVIDFSPPRDVKGRFYKRT
jgi:hypothetical protein